MLNYDDSLYLQEFLYLDISIDNVHFFLVKSAIDNPRHDELYA